MCVDEVDYTTTDPDRAAAVIQDSYRVTGGVRISGVTDGFSFSQRVRGTGDFTMGRFQCSVTVNYDGPLGGLLCVEQIHAGRLSFRTARQDLRTVAGDVCLVPPHEPWRAASEEIDLAPLTLDRDKVAAHAAAITGIEPDTLQFTGLEPISPARARYWNATVAHIRDDVLGNPDVAAEPLVRAEAFRALAFAMLTTFPNTAMASLTEPAPGSWYAEPQVLQRALTFIDEHAHQPIGPAEIAAAARIGSRELQDLFRRHLNRTPLGHLRQVRLARAHDDLRSADLTRGGGIGAVAARWGFTDPVRFADEYRTMFGRPPAPPASAAEDVEQRQARANDAATRAHEAHARAAELREESLQTRRRVEQIIDEHRRHARARRPQGTAADDHVDDGTTHTGTEGPA